MKIRHVDVSEADQASAQMFFDALFTAYDLHQARVLDAFARNGQLTVESYVHRLQNARVQLHLWELAQEHKEALKKFTSNVSIGDSYETVTTALDESFDLVVIDTPQGLHTDNTGTVHAEHWDFLQMVLPKVARPGVVVLYVNKMPYDARVIGHHGYDEYQEYDYDKWMRARHRFYGFERTHKEEEFVGRYRRFLDQQGRSVQSVLITPCHSDVDDHRPYAMRLALELK